MKKMKGIVKFFNDQKGYGFIKPEDGSGDVFVHISAVKDSNYETLAQDEVVEFVKSEGRNGKFQAENITILN